MLSFSSLRNSNALNINLTILLIQNYVTPSTGKIKLLYVDLYSAEICTYQIVGYFQGSYVLKFHRCLISMILVPRMV